MRYAEKLKRDVANINFEIIYEFAALKRQVVGVPGTIRRLAHPAFEEIIKMGPKIYPLLVNLVVTDDYTPQVWSWALSQITKNFPMMDETWTVQTLKDYWFDWYMRQ